VQNLKDACAAVGVSCTIESEHFPVGLKQILAEQDESSGQLIGDILDNSTD
jgi:hypothetical protein